MRIDNEKLNLLIAERSTTLKALCKESGIAESTMSKMRNGRRKQRFATFGKIAKALNVSVAEIVIMGDGPERRDS